MNGFVSFFLDQLFPETCVVCGKGIEGKGYTGVIVPEGWPGETLSFLIGGLHHSADGFSRRVICPDCLYTLERAKSDAFLPSYRYKGSMVRIISPFFINDPLLKLIHFLKFGGGKVAAASFSWWMALSLGQRLPDLTLHGVPLKGATKVAPSGAGFGTQREENSGNLSSESMSEIENSRFRRMHINVNGVRDITDRIIVVPVPLHRWREVSRGYNQAEELARGVCTALRLRSATEVVRRIKRTRRQSNLPAERRKDNVKGAFALIDGSALTGRDVIAVDDLVTTGETMVSFVEELAKTNPSSITVLSAARSRKLSQCP